MPTPIGTTKQGYEPRAINGWVNDIKRLSNTLGVNYDDIIKDAWNTNETDIHKFQDYLYNKYPALQEHYGTPFHTLTGYQTQLNNLSRNLLKSKNYTIRFYGDDKSAGNPKNSVAYGNRQAVLKDTGNPFSQYYGGTPVQRTTPTAPNTPTTPTAPTNPVNPTTPTVPVAPVAPTEQEDYTTSLNKINSLYDRWSQNMKSRQLKASNFGKQVAAKPLIEPIHEVVGHDLNRRQARRVWNGKQVRLEPGQGRQTLDRWEGYGYWNTPKRSTGHMTMRYQGQMPVFDSTGAVSQNQVNNTNLDMTGYGQAQNGTAQTYSAPANTAQTGGTQTGTTGSSIGTQTGTTGSSIGTQTGTTGSSIGSRFTPTSWNPVLSNLQVQASAKRFKNTMNNMRNSFKHGGKFINWINIPSARNGARLMPIAQSGGRPWRGAPKDGSLWGGGRTDNTRLV